MTLLYRDTSVLLKRYVDPAESEALLGRIQYAPAVGTALITRLEVAAALAKGARPRAISLDEWTGDVPDAVGFELM